MSKSRAGARRASSTSPRSEHADIAPALGMDFETGTRLSGARFTFLRGGMARLHRALGQFMLDVQTGEHGYTECNPPVLVRRRCDVRHRQAAEVCRGSASSTTNGRWLIPTAEVSLTASVMGEIARRGRPAHAPHRAHPVLPLRSGRGGARYARLHPPAPVRKVRAGQHRAARRTARPNTSAWSARAETILERARTCPIASCCCAPATWALARARPTTSKSGCPARAPTARSARARTPATSRRAA